MRAPWRWRWGQIAGLLAGLTLAALVIWWAPVLGIAAAGWLALWIRAGYREPLPHREVPPSPIREEAAHSVKHRYNGAQVTVTERGGLTRVSLTD